MKGLTEKDLLLKDKLFLLEEKEELMLILLNKQLHLL